MKKADHQPGLLIVISGPSGVGKTTITKAVLERLGAAFSVSATTRPKTDAEVHGRDYYFVDEAEFERMIKAGELVEHARVFDHFYGTPRQPVEETLATGQCIVLDIDVQGGLQIREAMPGAYLVFLLPPGEEALLDRLRGRRRESEERIQRRFREAQHEMKTAKDSGAYDLFVVNENLDEAIAEVLAAIRECRGGS